MPAIRIVLAREYDERGTGLGPASVGRLDATFCDAHKDDYFVFGASAPPNAEQGCPTLAFLQERYVRDNGHKVYAPLTPRLGWGTYAELRAALLTALELAVQLGADAYNVVVHTSADHMPRVRACVRLLLEKVPELAPLRESGVVSFVSSAPDLTLWGKCREVVALALLLCGITTTPRWVQAVTKFLHGIGEYEIRRMQSGEMPTVPRE